MKTESGNGRSESKGLAPPYISFKTLLALWDRMHTNGVPPRIDRSFLSGMSGGYQTQVLNALRYLGLIQGDEGTVAIEMYDLVIPETRQKSVAQLLMNRYPEAMKLGDENATHGQLVETFRDLYDLAAETQDKAIAFFLQAAKYADISLSPFFKKPRTTSGTRKRIRRKPKTPAADGGVTEETPAPKGRSMFSLTFRSGGAITLHGDFDPFALEPDERDLVYGLVDKMREHQSDEDDESDEE